MKTNFRKAIKQAMAAKGAIAALKNTLGNNSTPVVVVKGNNETYVLK